MADHAYTSTACLHATEPGREALHQECDTNSTRWDGTPKTPASCKWCHAPCQCPHHKTPDPVPTTDGPVDTPPDNTYVARFAMDANNYALSCELIPATGNRATLHINDWWQRRD